MQTKISEIGNMTPQKRITMILFTEIKQKGCNVSLFLEMMLQAYQLKTWEYEGLTLQEYITRPYNDGGIGCSSIDQFKALIHLKHHKEEEDECLSKELKELRRDIIDMLLPDVNEHGVNNDRTFKGNRHTGSTKYFSSGVCDTNSTRSTVSNKEYRSARIKKQRPDLYKQVQSGELSVHAAWTKSGFLKARISINSENPKSAAKSILSKCDIDYIEALIQELQKELP